jgi:biopolymer transport protein TolR
MGMSAGGGKGGSMSEPNMTPMIDVLLVLLVIFIIIQPMLQKSIDVQIPEKEQQKATQPAPQIVLEIFADSRMAINTQPVAINNLEGRLREIYTNRPDKVLFVKADGQVQYQTVIEAMDAARGAGVKVLGGVIP